jgi:hypothetical protein
MKKNCSSAKPPHALKKKITSSATYATSETPSSSIVAPCHVNTYKKPLTARMITFPIEKTVHVPIDICETHSCQAKLRFNSSLTMTMSIDM